MLLALLYEVPPELELLPLVLLLLLLLLVSLAVELVKPVGFALHAHAAAPAKALSATTLKSLCINTAKFSCDKGLVGRAIGGRMPDAQA